MAKQKAEKLNKSQAIRDLLQEMPNAKPNEVAAKFKELHGIEVSAAYVSTIKSTSKKGKKESGGKVATGRPKKSESGSANGDRLNQVMELAAEVGGLKKLREKIDQLIESWG